MAAPDSVLIVTNVGLPSVWVGGIEILQNDSSTYDKDHIAGVTADIHFWSAYLAGALTLNLCGVPVPVATPAVVAFLVAVAIGDISP